MRLLAFFETLYDWFENWIVAFGRESCLKQHMSQRASSAGDRLFASRRPAVMKDGCKAGHCSGLTRFHLAKAYLEMGKRRDASTQLQMIENGKTLYAQRARDTLSEMRDVDGGKLLGPGNPS